MKKIILLIALYFIQDVAIAQNQDVLFLGQRQDGYATNNVVFTTPNTAALDTIPSIKYETQVNPAGAFTVTVPIEVPKGRGSLQPNLALGYNSQSNIGNVGFGWNLIGLSSITRGGKSKTIDGNNDGPQQDNTDPYYLDGERLIETTPNNFVTEKYSKIIITKQPSGAYSFIINYTDGKIAKYKELVTGQHYIVELIDAFDNVVTYSYHQGQNNWKLPLLQYVNYQGGQIEFFYVNRNKANSIYRNGIETKIDYMYHSLVVRYQDTNNQYHLHRKYHLHRDLIQNGHTERLYKIEVENANGDFLRPLILKYNNENTAGFNLEQKHAGYGNPFDPNRVHKNFGLGSMAMGDFFGKGKMSLVYSVNDGNNQRMYAPELGYLNYNFNVSNYSFQYDTNFFSGKILRNNKITERDQIIAHKIEYGNPVINDNDYGCEITDTHIYDKFIFNFRDLVTQENSQIEFSLPGYGEIESTMHVDPNYGNYYTCAFKPYKNNREIIVQDLNNDGLVDLLIVQKYFNFPPPQPTLTHFSAPLVLFAEIGKHQANGTPIQWIELNHQDNGATGYNYTPTFSKIQTLEIDGDGRVELMFIHDTNKYSIFKIDLANQRLKPIPTMQNITLHNYGNDTPMVFGDYNGDGLTDFMTPDTIYDINTSTIPQVVYAINNHYLGWKRYISTGTGFIVTQEDFSQQKIAYIKPSQGAQSVSAIHNKKFTWKSLWGGDVQAVVSESDYGTSHVFAMDINNDGKSDLVSLKKFGRVKIEEPTNGDYLKYSFSNKNDVINITGSWQFNGSTNVYVPNYTVVPLNNVNNITFHINDPTTTGNVRFIQHPQQVDLRNQLMSPFSVFVPTSDFNYLHTYKPGFVFHDAMLNSRLYEFNLQNFQEGLITKIEDGTQNFSKVEYSQMLKQTQEYDNATYKTKPHTLDYPYYVHHNNPQHYLVKKLHTFIKLDNNPHRILTKEYRYENATQHLDGKGFLGFQRTFSSDVYESKALNNGKYLPNEIFKPIFWTINSYDPQYENTLAQSTYGSLDDSAVFSRMTTTYQKYNKPNHRYLILSTAENNKDFLKDVTITKSYEYDIANDFLLKKAITNYNATASTIEEYQYKPAFSNGNHYFFGRIQEVKNTAVRDGAILTSKEETLYNTNGTVLETKKYGHNTPAITTTFTYFPYGELQSETLQNVGTPPVSLTTSYLYDATQRFLHKTTTPDGLVTTRNVTPLGWVTSETSPLGHTTSYQHDTWGNVHTVTNYLGIKSKTRRLLNTGGPQGSYRISQKTDHAPETITTFDSRDLAIETKTETLNNQWVYARKEYDLFGKTLRSSQPFFEGETIKWEVSEYDEMNRLSKFTSHNGRVMTTCYEKLTVTVTDGHRKHSRTIDATGQTVKHTDAGGTIFYKYHPNGSLKETNYDGIKTTIKIDGWGNKIELNDPSAGIYKYEYDNLSRITKETNPKNGITTYTYDNLGRPLTEAIVSTTENTNIAKSFEYHPTTFLPTKITGTSNGASYEYETLYHDPITGVPDPYYRIRGKKETTPQLVNESYTFYDTVTGRVDETTQKTTVLVNNNFTTETKIKNSYNSISILTEQTDVTTNKQIWKLNAINARGQVTQMQYGNGFAITNTYNANTYSLEEIKHQRGTATPIMFLKYQYNVLKGVLDSRENVTFGSTETYQYDDLDRLLKETVNNVVAQEYTYDKRGRITSNTALGQYDYAPNSYKLNGVQYNTAGQTVNTNRGFAEIQYNAFKNPNEIFLAGKDRISYDYGILKTRAVAYYGSLNTNKLARPNRKYFSADKTVEIVKIGTQTRVITYLTGDPYSANYIKINVLNNNTPVSKTNYFLHRDNQGTILALSNAATGANVEQRYLDAWGNLKGARVNGITTSLNNMGWVTTPPSGVGGLLLDRGYTGHEHLTSVGLIHMNGRIYDPILRQFMSPDNYVQDPYNTQNFNRFGYVLNNPLLYTDPSGEIILEALVVALVATTMQAVNNIANGIPFWHGIGSTFAATFIQSAIGFGVGGIPKVPLPIHLGYAAFGQILDTVMPKISIKTGNWTFTININILMGHSYGVGASISATFDDGEFFFAAGFGFTKYSDYNGMGINGWEYRGSAMVGYGGKDFRLSLGTNLWWGLKGHEGESLNQQTGILKIKSGDIGLSYENDGNPFGLLRKDGTHRTLSPRLGDGKDSHRTAAINLTVSTKINGKYEDIGIGTNLFTGYRDYKGEEGGRDPNLGPDVYNGVNFPRGQVIEKGTPYRFGGLYFTYKNLRLGINSERYVVYPIQARFAHGLFAQGGFPIIDPKTYLYIQYQTTNSFTTW